MNNQTFKVCVRSFTYNQAKYITDTMNGFVMQETNFPFVCCIVDDNSTDGEQEVIRNYFNENFNLEDKDSYYEQDTDYVHILYGQHKTNLNCYFAILFLKENHYSQHKSKLPYLSTWRDNCKFEALCEGDDYWIDSLKLQKQVTLMESNPKCVLCYTGFDVVNEYKEKTNNRYRKLICYSGNVFDYLLKTNFIQTVTVLAKTELCNKAMMLMTERKSKYDYGLFLELSLMGEFQYINEKTAAYRICEESASHSKSLKRNIQFALDVQRVKYIYYNLQYKPKCKLEEKKEKIKLIIIITTKYYLKNIISFKY